jgi:hypothetical protein
MRGLVPSLGAGGSLIAAALCALAVLGGVLAFRGQSRGPAVADAQDLAIPASRIHTRSESTKASPAPVRASASATMTRSREGTAAPPRRVTASLPKPTPAAPQAEAAPTRPAPPAGDSGTPIPLPATPAPGTVTRAVQQTRAATRPVVDVAPQPAHAPVNAVADTVEHVAGTVDALLP